MASTPEYVNIRIKRTTRDHLKKIAAKGSRFSDIIEKLLHDVEYTEIDFNLIDNQDPTAHSVLFTVGHAQYLYSKGKASLVPKV